MNKTLLKISFVVALVTLGAGSAMAASSISSSTVLGGGTFSPSKSVTISADTGFGTDSTCVANTTATNPCNTYAARAKHGSGKRIVGTNSADPKIYYSDLSDVSASMGTADVSDTFSTWTAL